MSINVTVRCDHHGCQALLVVPHVFTLDEVYRLASDRDWSRDWRGIYCPGHRPIATPVEPWSRDEARGY